jgi:hypothetical protein
LGFKVLVGNAESNGKVHVVANLEKVGFNTSNFGSFVGFVAPLEKTINPSEPLNVAVESLKQLLRQGLGIYKDALWVSTGIRVVC